MLRVNGDYGFWAEIEPAPSGRVPWPGRLSRWWFEVNGPSDDPRCETEHYHMYDGGGLSLRRCLWNAVEAVYQVEADYRIGVVKT